jgi:formate hydrogenlyase transcriptional activator
MEALIRYPWPGNIRELQNVIERAVILSRGHVLTVPVGELSLELKMTTSRPQDGNLQDMLQRAERVQILRALEQANWVVAGPNGAAVRLGMKRSTVMSRMHKLGIKVSRTGFPIE